MKITRTIIGAPAVLATTSLFQFAVSVQPYGSNFAVAPPGAPVVDNAFEITRFGPAGCVSTWKNQASHCVIRTECKKQSLMDYNIRLICIDKGSEAVRHVFGKGSFDPQETFDTLVVCDQCTAEEAMQQGPGPAPAPAAAMVPPTGPYPSFAASADVAKLSATVQSLSTEVHELAVGMAANAESVKKLESAVFGANSSGAAAKNPAIVAPTQAGAGSSGPAAQMPATQMVSGEAPSSAFGAPAQVEAPVAAVPSATATPTQDLTRWGTSKATVASTGGRRIVLGKRRLVRQQQPQQKELEDMTPAVDEAEAQKPSQTQLDAAEDRLQADEGNRELSADQSSTDDDAQGSVEFVTDNTDQTAQDEEYSEDGAADGGDYNQDD